MLDRILKLGKEAAIYGLSSIVGRFLNFLLVPFYTNFLTRAEYGVVSNVYTYIAVRVRALWLRHGLCVHAIRRISGSQRQEADY